MSIVDIIEAWVYWRITGTCLVKQGGDESGVANQTTGSKPLIKGDHLERKMEQVFTEKLTDKQRLIITVEYRASSNVPHTKSIQIRADMLTIKIDDYKKTLQRARRIIGNAFGVL